jgi:periplasmic divalent cation tolerance protein
MNILLLTCADNKEADKIVKSLLNKKLIACAKKVLVSSSFLWKGKVDSDDEVLVIMESLESKFNEIEREVRKLHSYETFVLVSLPVSKASTGVLDWIKESLGEK